MDQRLLVGLPEKKPGRVQSRLDRREVPWARFSNKLFGIDRRGIGAVDLRKICFWKVWSRLDDKGPVLAL